jgi:tRNA/tmRNA/rRNA uracil-C5-methylase (TrmA/RlmC/RlmD family)
MNDVRIEKAALGGGVGRLDDGRVVFVRHALVGERVRVNITEERSTFSRGDAVTILEASADRVEPPCPYAQPGLCGGCDLQHATPSAQREWKANIVAEQLDRVAHTPWEVVVEDVGPARGSRTRMRFAVTDEGQLALRTRMSRDLVGLDSCWLLDESAAAAFDTQWTPGTEVEIRTLGEKAFAVIHHDTGSHHITDLAGKGISPTTTSRVTVQGHTYQVSPTSFWQSHRDAPDVLTTAVLAAAEVQKGDTVSDLYGGVGLFGAPLLRAAGSRGHLYSVESSPSSLMDARVNLAGLGKLTLRKWNISPRAINDAVFPDSVCVVDPPRTGLGRGVAAALGARAPRRLVYVSCDAPTFARDLSALQMAGFSLRNLRVFDLFPMTEHVEIVATLDLHL